MEEDKRFAHVATDPKFRRIPKGERKVKIDKRFQSMFKDEKFRVKYTVDKRGRPVKHSTTEDLRRYYDIDSEEDTDEDKAEGEAADEAAECKTKPKSKQIIGKDKTVDDKIIEDGDNIESDEDADQTATSDLKIVKKTDKQVPNKIKKKLKNLKIDYARGEGNLLSDESSSDDETDDEVDKLQEEAAGIDHKWGELDADAEVVSDVTHRLAACNMDWDRIRAVDLLVLFNSFLPPGGNIAEVTIYPSEYGKQRIADEDVKGPTELLRRQRGDTDMNEARDEQQSEGSKYHMEKLRQYQLNRLKYYYAVITCDSAATANKIYTECDGMEYESSATKIDLRFIPDAMTFEDAPKESCTEAPDGTKYKPRYFTTTALQQAKVDLTWDETNPERAEIAQKLASGKIDDVPDADLQNYLASSSGEEEDGEDGDIQPKNSEDGPIADSESESEEKETKAIDKYRLLLQEIESKEKSKKENDVGMEITWGIDLQKKTDKMIKEKKTAGDSKTPFEQYLEKRKEKRKEKKAARKTEADDNSGNDEDDAPSDIDMDDPYFAEEFNDEEFKSTKSKKSKQTKELIDSDYDSEEEEKNRAQLELLLHDDKDDKKHFSLKKIQDAENVSKSKLKQRKKKNKGVDDASQQDDFKLNVNDERFSALFSSHHYNIDPTDPHYKKTKNMEKLIDEKIRRREAEDAKPNTGASKKPKFDDSVDRLQKSNAELSVLVKSVKRKASAVFNNKGKKK